MEDFMIGHALVVALLTVYFGQASAFTGRDLKTACDAGERYEDGGSGFKAVGDAYSGGECLGYIHGINDALANGLVCVTPGVTVGEEVKSVRQFLKQHPAQLQLPAADLVLEALSKAYPCPVESALDSTMQPANK
jgi:Rap1a immunity proteins